MKLKILKYNKNKAVGKFILFKFLELFALFLFTFGFESLGRVVYERFDWMVFSPVTYIGFWFYGFVSLFLSLLILASIVGFILLIFDIFKYWFKLNWRWAKISAEDEDSKIERLSEQKKLKEIKRIEGIEEQRKKYGYCIGDKVIAKGKVDGLNLKGSKGKVVDIDEDDMVGIEFEKEFEKGHSCDGLGKDGYCRWCPKGSFKMLIKVNLPKKPKLNKVREKEINDRKSKE